MKNVKGIQVTVRAGLASAPGQNVISPPGIKSFDNVFCTPDFVLL